MRRYQTFGSRFLSAIIDGLAVSLVGGLIFKSILGSNYMDELLGQILYDGFFYLYSIFLFFFYGQTLGKKITNIKVVSYVDETKLIGLVNAIKRDSVGIVLAAVEIYIRQSAMHDSSLAHWLVNICSFGWVLAELFSMLFNRKRRAIHDFLANSVVIDVKAYPALKVSPVRED